MFEFSRVKQIVEVLPPAVRVDLAELDHDLVTIELPETRAMDTLDVGAQTPEALATAVPGDALSIVTQDAQVEGQIYTLGQSPIFIAQRVIGPTRPEYDENCIENSVVDINRTVKADKHGQWFEHVYPLGKDVREALSAELNLLVQYAKESGSFFIIAVIDQAYVVMPATMNRKIWKGGPSERYAQYANLRDGYGELATQAMIYIDPGEASGLTNSEQLGLMDRDLPVGQLQYDVDTEGVFVDTISEDFQRGRRLKIFNSIASYGLRGSDWGYDINLEGPVEERRFVDDETTEVKRLAWEVKRR